MKKILILDTGKEWGGGTNSLLELLRRADRRRYSFTALFYDNYAKGRTSDLKTELKKLDVELLILDRARPGFTAKAAREAVRAFFCLAPGLKKKYLFYLEFKTRIMPDAGRIATVIKDNGFDLLYMNNQPSSNLEGIIAAHSAGVPCLQHARIETALNDIEADAVNRFVSKVICVSAGVRDGLVRSGVAPDKCVVVHNGIDAGLKTQKTAAAVRKELGIPEGRLVIGTVGSLVKRKRIHLLIEAAAALDNVFCIIVGDGPERAALTAMAERIKIKGRVLFTGFSTDAVSYINAMDVFVLPSEKEGFPRVILEAMLMARPVVAFDVAGASEMIDDGVTGRILNDCGAQAIAETVKEITSNNPARIREMGAAGRERVTNEFGIDRYVSGVCAIFDGILAGRAD
ncbi:MAG: glycosyltransferase [Deltaproteobacteria bacterium]|nr:glycosyltransferase [Deltaproteobacteria bacterium]